MVCRMGRRKNKHLHMMISDGEAVRLKSVLASFRIPKARLVSWGISMISEYFESGQYADELAKDGEATTLNKLDEEVHRYNDLVEYEETD